MDGAYFFLLTSESPEGKKECVEVFKKEKNKFNCLKRVHV